MSRLIFNADTLGGTTTLSSADAVGNFTITVPAVNGTLSVKDASNDATFRNITLTGAVLAGAWNGSTIAVAYGGTGATTLSGLVFGNGASAMTAATAAQVVSVIGATFVTNATNATNATSATTATNIAGGLSGSIPYQTGAGATALLPKGTNGQVLALAAGLPAWVSVAGTGTVTSVNGSGGTTGLTLTGGPITASGTLTLGGTLAVANGGTGVTSLGTGVVAALGVNVGTAGAFVINGGALGTPSSGTVTNLTGTASININGTVGATTPAAGAFTSLSATSQLTLTNASDYNLYASGAGANFMQGKLGIGAVPAASTITLLGSNLATGAATVNNIIVNSSIQSDVTTQYNSYSSNPGTAATAFTLPNLRHFTATQQTFGVGSTVTNQFGFRAESTLTGATNNYGFYGNIASGTGRFNFYAAGTAVNYFAGNVGIGTTTPAAKLAVVGTGYSPAITLTDGATLNWDTSLGQVAQVTLGGNRTFAAPTNLVDGGFYSLLIIQDGTGSRTISWNAVFDFTGGTAPTLSTAAGSKDLITWRSDGTNMLEVGRSLGVA